MLTRTRRTARRWAVPTLLAVTVLACGDDPLGPRDPEDVDFAPALDIRLDRMTRLESGVYVESVREGQEPTALGGDRVRVTYTLWLPDGTEVFTATDVVHTLVASQQVVQGFVHGVTGMRTGEIRKIVVPSELGYGAEGGTGVPAHSVLVYRVELLAIAPPD